MNNLTKFKSIFDTYQMAFHMEVTVFEFALLVSLNFSTSYPYVHTASKKCHLLTQHKCSLNTNDFSSMMEERSYN